MFWQTAYAQAAQGTPQGPNMVEQLLPFIVIFGIFYFLILRPQSKRHKEHANFVTNMKRGDNVITSGGIYGTVQGISDKFVTLEVSDGVQIRILKTQIATAATEGKANA